MGSSGSDIITDSDSLDPVKYNNIPKTIYLHNSYPINSYERPTSKESSDTGCFKRLFHIPSIEILAFLILFSMALTQITTTSMILNKVCLVHYNHTQEICDNLDNYTKIKSEVEKTASNYQLGYSLIQTLPSAILSCFIGPWSDLYGRKPPIIVALVGVSSGPLGSTLCAYFMKSRVEYLYIPAFFSSCSGGMITILAVIYSYASDLTTEGHRTMKFFFLEMAVGLGLPLGLAAGGWTWRFLGYSSVFLMSASGFVISLMWVSFLLPETRGRDDDSKPKVLFTFKTFKENFEATTKMRPDKGREQIFLLIISMCFAVAAIYGTRSITFLFTHYQYNWGETKYSTITAIYSIIAVLILAIMVPASKYFKLSDAILGMIGTASLILKYICLGFAWNSILFHFGSILGCLAGCALIAARSRISKIVSNDDLGKVFSLMASAETLFPVLMIVLITEIFNVCIDIHPAMPYLILAVCLVLPLSVFIWIACMSKKNSTYKRFETETLND